MVTESVGAQPRPLVAAAPEQEQQLRHAVEFARIAAERTPHDPIARWILGTALLNLSDHLEPRGHTLEAFDFAHAAHLIREELIEWDPRSTAYQRDLSISYIMMGDLYQELCQGDQAREAYEGALKIRQRLAEQEPVRAEYQRDLSISYHRMGDLYWALGQGEQAREAVARALKIAHRLAE